MKNKKILLQPRIITGEFKGKRLKVPEGARPVTDRVKTTIFDILGDSIQGQSVLDLFAGSGNLGIEALSRGALNVTFVDQSWDSIDAINANIEGLPENKIKIIKDDYLDFFKKLKKSSGKKFNIIFVDPPFDHSEQLYIEAIVDSLEPNGIVILKAPENFKLKQSQNYQMIDQREIGINTIYFLGKANPQIN